MLCVWFRKNIQIFILSIFMFLIHSSLPVLASDAGGNFSSGPDMTVNRMAHYSILLSDGKVLLLGGHGTNFTALDSAEIFDPNTNQFTLLTMNSPRDIPAVAKLQDGRYLIAGGAHDWGIAPGYNTAEIYNPSNNTFTTVNNLNYARTGCSAATLSNGNVLIVGGWYSDSAGVYGEIFNPSTNSFSLTGPLNTPRSYALVVPVASNKAFVIGGTGVYGGSNIERVELYDSSTNTFTIFRETLFEGESGWIPLYQYKVIDDFKLWNGKYLLLAQKLENNEYRYALFTVDPNTLNISKLNIDLPDTGGDLASLTLLGVDNIQKKAYILGNLDLTPPPSTLRLYTVDLVNMTITCPTGSYTVTQQDYYVSSFGTSILSDGRIFITGGTSRTDWYYNFYPVKYTLLISPTAIGIPNLKVLQPNGGQKWNAGSKYIIKWEAPLNSSNFTLKYSTDDKKTWSDITTLTASQGCTSDGTKYTCTYLWTIPAQDGRKPRSFIRVIAMDSANQPIGTDDSDRAFAIEVLRVTSPNGGETLKIGCTHTITWHIYALTKTVSRVQLQYSTNNGQSWNNIAIIWGNPLQFNWIVPNSLCSNCKVRVILRDSAGRIIAFDKSDRVFTIQN